MPSYTDLKAIITMNLIKDNKITHKDINLVKTVFGKSMGEIKGKPIIHHNMYETNDSIDIPKKLIQKDKNLKLSIGTMYVNGLLFLTSISHDLYYLIEQYLPSRQKSNYIKSMKEMLTIY